MWAHAARAGIRLDQVTVAVDADGLPVGDALGRVSMSTAAGDAALAAIIDPCARTPAEIGDQRSCWENNDVQAGVVVGLTRTVSGCIVSISADERTTLPSFLAFLRS